MSWARADAAEYVALTLTTWLSQAGIDTVDGAGDLKEPIDEALLMMGVAESDLATATVTETFGFRKVLRYAALMRIADAFGDRPTSKSVGGPASLSKSYDNKRLSELIAAARDAASPFITVALSSEWGTGTIDLDFIEPVITG